MKQEKYTLCIADVFKARNVIYGLAAIYILFFHIDNSVGAPAQNILGQVFSVICRRGNVGVDIFVVLSGMGLVHSIEKHSIKDFFYNRMKRLLPSFFICAIPFFIWWDFIVEHDGINSFLLNVTTLNAFLIGRGFRFWYVAFIIYAYLMFPFIYQLDKKTNHISSAVVITLSVALNIIMMFKAPEAYGIYEIYISRIPAFIIGMLIGKVGTAKFISTKQICCIVLLGLMAGFLVYLNPLNLLFLRYIGLPFALGIIVFISFVMKYVKENVITKKFCMYIEFLGGISLELYVVQIIILKVLRYYELFSRLDNFIWWGLLTGVVLVVSYLVSSASKNLCNLIRKMV